MRVLLLSVLAAIAISAGMAAAALASDETASSGTVTATLNYGADPLDTSGATLSITRAGATLFNAAIPNVVCDGCVLAGNGADDIHVLDLDGDHEPEVVVTASTGGATCCVQLGVWDFTGPPITRLTSISAPSASTSRTSTTTASPSSSASTGASMRCSPTRRSSSRRRISSTICIQDGVPVFAPVTTEFPSVMPGTPAEAKRRVSRITKKDHDATNAVGLLTTYSADQLLLGKGAKAGLKLFDAQAKRGILGSAGAAKKARSRMLSFLSKHHYR